MLKLKIALFITSFFPLWVSIIFINAWSIGECILEKLKNKSLLKSINWDNFIKLYCEKQLEISFSILILFLSIQMVESKIITKIEIEEIFNNILNNYTWKLYFFGKDGRNSGSPYKFIRVNFEEIFGLEKTFDVLKNRAIEKIFLKNYVKFENKETFKTIPSRMYLNLNEDRLNGLDNMEMRQNIAENLGLEIREDKFNFNNLEQIKNFIKYLSNRIIQEEGTGKNL